METVKHLLHDQAQWWAPTSPDEQSVTDLLDVRGVKYTDVAGWARLDEHEIALGEPAGRARVKVVDRQEMIDISRG
jgi:ferredoxin--NADP+ reductase